MIQLEVHANGDECWPDLKIRPYIEGRFVSIARLPRGTFDGKSTVTVRIETANGQIILAQTTLVLLTNAVNIFNIADTAENGDLQQ